MQREEACLKLLERRVEERRELKRQRDKLLGVLWNIRGELGRIIEQLESRGYECEAGPLEKSPAFAELKEVANGD